MADPASELAAHATRQRARWVVRGLWAVLAVAALLAVVTVLDTAILSGLSPIAPAGWWDVSETLDTVLGSTYTLVFLVTGLLFVRWHRQTLRNLRALGCRDLTFGVGLASWSWLIPLLNLFVPYRSIREAAKHSAPDGEPDLGPLVGLWWAAWLLTSVTASAAMIAYLFSETSRSWLVAATLDLFDFAVELLAAFLAMRVATLLSRQQLAKAESLRASEAADGGADGSVTPPDAVDWRQRFRI